MSALQWLKSFTLDVLHGRAGLPRTVNGVPMRVLPRHRDRFPAEYDPPVAAFLRQRVKPGMTCFNVGANVGIYALQLARWSGPGGQVVAFEPNPATAAVLKRHVELNQGIGSPIRVVAKAVSSAPGKAPFHLEGTDGMSRLGRPNPLLHQARTVEVEVTTLDRFCVDEKLRPDWVLIDVEGFEIAALLGFRETVAARGGELGIVVEMHPGAWGDAGTTREDFARLLDELGLRPAPLTGQADPWNEYGLVHLERKP